jgi:hypothetical protein
MRRYSEAVKADVRRRMHPPHRQSEPRILKELGTINSLLALSELVWITRHRMQRR